MFQHLVLHQLQKYDINKYFKTSHFFPGVVDRLPAFETEVFFGEGCDLLRSFFGSVREGVLPRVVCALVGELWVLAGDPEVGGFVFFGVEG